MLLAWHIPRELMNNNPLTEEEVRRRYSEKGKFEEILITNL